jgi:hypothetical protein
MTVETLEKLMIVEELKLRKLRMSRKGRGPP